MEKISKRLNEAMKIRNMKPIELSEKTGIDKGSISLYLSGKYNPKSKRIYMMASILNVNPTWLLGYDVPMELNNNIPKNAYDEQIDQIALDNGIKIIIDKNAPLTAESVLEVQKVLSEVLEKQQKK